MADDHTEEATAVPADTGQLSTWTVDHLATRFRALTPVNTRKAQGVDRDEAKQLFDAMAATIAGLEARVRAEVDGKRRVVDDRAKLRELNAELTDQLAARADAGGPPKLPARAVAEVKGATLAVEHTAELIEGEARQRAAQIIEDARSRAAAILAGIEPPPVTGDEPTDFAAEVEWLAHALPEAERRLVDLRDRKATRLAEAERRQAELDRWAGVLPLAQRQLTAGTALAVTEAAS